MKQWIGLGLLLCCLEACAIADEGNRRVLNYLDADWSPPTTAGRVLAAPLALPVGVVAAAADAVIVHPATQLDEAWADTADFVWDYDGISAFGSIMLAPFSVLVTPVVFGCSWVSRGIFGLGRGSESSSAEVATDGGAEGG
jgi:hypothetical protein